VTQDAGRALLGGLIDYAGLFPPAQLDMADAVAGYRAARSGPHAWMLDRFVCPAPRLAELAAEAGDVDWPVTVTVDLADVAGVASYAGPLAVDAVEVRLSQDAGAEGVARLAGARLPRCFVEVPLGDSTAQVLDAVAAADLAAKVRCGGAVAAPDPAALAAFVAGCAARDLDWKATAGLHHPIRHRDAAGGWEHGFLNVLAAAGLAEAGADAAGIEAALADGDVNAFAFGDAGLRWRDREIGARARRRFDGYGSCSFDEPVEDLIALGILEAAVRDG